MKKKSLLLFILVAVLGFILPKDVFAVGTSLKFTTTVNDWKAGTDLSYSCGSSSVNVTPTVYVGADASHLTATTCNFSFDSLNLNANDDFIIVEEYDFSSYSGTNPEYQNITIYPGAVSSATIDYDDDTYMFGNYTPLASQPAVLYNMNPVDQNNNITGPLYVYDAFFEIGGEKEVEVDLGSISIPSYCVNYHFNVKGNIASSYGTFYITQYRTDQFSIHGDNGTTQNICELNNTPLTKAQYDALIGTAATYEDVDRDDEYVMAVTPGSESTVSGVRTTEVYVTATLESDGSQTGLLYTVIPFVILISSVVIGYFIIKNNEVKEDKEII